MPTVKHRLFVNEPIGEKSVRALPGIGEAHGTSFEDKGFGKAYAVLGQFLRLNKDARLFRDWLKVTGGLNARQQDQCYNCLREWSETFL